MLFFIICSQIPGTLCTKYDDKIIDDEAGMEVVQKGINNNNDGNINIDDKEPKGND